MRGPGVAHHLTSTLKSSDVTNVRSCLISKTLDEIRDKTSDKLQITANLCYYKIIFVFGQQLSLQFSVLGTCSMLQRLFYIGTKIKKKYFF